MENLKHTKGEWEVRGNRIFVKDTYRSIAIVEMQDNFDIVKGKAKEDFEAIANAKIITSAPDLLETLIEIRSKIQYEQGMNAISKSGKDWSIELKMANEAINKATK